MGFSENMNTFMMNTMTAISVRRAGSLDTVQQTGMDTESTRAAGSTAQDAQVLKNVHLAKIM